jgi:hypothetical protein
MGIMKGSKLASISEDARKVHEEGRSVFVCRYWDEVLNFQGTGSIVGASEAIEMVEAEGWRLEHLAYSWSDGKKRGLSVMMFRRA